MGSFSTNVERIPGRGAMPLAHRLFIVMAAILAVLAEALVVDCFFGKNRLLINLYTATCLAGLVAMPMAVGIIFYAKMKRLTSLSPIGQVDWHVVRFLWTLLLFICYSSMVGIIVVLLTGGLRVKI